MVTWWECARSSQIGQVVWESREKLKERFWWRDFEGRKFFVRKVGVYIVKGFVDGGSGVVEREEEVIEVSSEGVASNTHQTVKFFEGNL